MADRAVFVKCEMEGTAQTHQCLAWFGLLGFASITRVVVKHCDSACYGLCATDFMKDIDRWVTPPGDAVVPE